MNQELYDQFLNAAVVLSNKDDFLNKINLLRDEWGDLVTKVSDAEKKAKSFTKRYDWITAAGGALLISGSILAAMIILPVLSMPFTLLMETQEAPGLLIIPAMLFMASFVIFPIMMIIWGKCLINNARKKRVDFKNQSMKDYQTLSAQAEPRIDEIEKEIDSLEKKLGNYIKESTPLMAFLPHTYHNLHAVGFMLSALENLRADNLTDVINLYEQELHHLEQMRVLNQTAEMQRIHNENMRYAMESVQRNQARINSNLQNIQMLQIIDILND